MDMFKGNWYGKGWIGVDLDGTLAYSDGWKGVDHNEIGPPILLMMLRVKTWLAEGRTVKIFTARCSHPHQLEPVQAWLDTHGLGHLEITNVKDCYMQQLWDDRAIQVTHNTGEIIGGM